MCLDYNKKRVILNDGISDNKSIGYQIKIFKKEIRLIFHVVPINCKKYRVFSLYLAIQ